MDANETDTVNVALTQDEALVLFDWLYRFNKQEHPFEDQAEQRVLWDLEALLERQVTGLFSSHYSELLASARERVRDVD